MVAVIVIVVVVVVVMVVHKGLDLHVRGVLLERSLHSTGLLGWHPSIERKGLSGHSELRWCRVDAIFFDEVFVNGEDVSPVVSSPALGVFRSRKHGALDLASLCEERLQSLSRRTTDVGDLDGLTAQFAQGHLDLGTLRGQAGDGHDTRGCGQLDLLEKRAEHTGRFAGFFGLSHVNLNAA